jgi:hypothetical protein
MLAKKEDKGDEDYKWLVILNYKPIIVLLACTEINTDWSESALFLAHNKSTHKGAQGDLPDRRPYWTILGTWLLLPPRQ